MSVGGYACVFPKKNKKTQRTCIKSEEGVALANRVFERNTCVFEWTKQKQTTQRTRIFSEGGVVPANRGFGFFFWV